MLKKFRLRKSITILGTKYKIIQTPDLKDEDGNLCMGLHDHIKKVILIDAKLPLAEKRQTFLHELFHAYLFEAYVREGLDTQLEEVIVEMLSQTIEKHFNIEWK